MALQESGEMYLETIYVLSRTRADVRAIDISGHMGYSKPSVSRAMAILRSGGYILVDKDGFITLTDTGRAVAETIFERHTVISQLLTRLGVDPVIAARDACRMEHAISDESFQALKHYLQMH